MRFIGENLNRLKKLLIDRFPETTGPLSIKFPALQDFQILSFGNSFGNPTIEKLTVHSMYPIAGSVIDEITVSAVTHAANVRHLKVAGWDPTCLNMFFDIFKNVGHWSCYIGT